MSEGLRGVEQRGQSTLVEAKEEDFFINMWETLECGISGNSSVFKTDTTWLFSQAYQCNFVDK